MLSLTFDRSSYPDLDPLVVTDYPSDGSPWWLPEDAITEPAWAFRTKYAPESDYIPGQVALAAVLDSSSLPVTLYVKAVEGVTLSQARAVIEGAVSQFSYDLTVTVDGETRTYRADPCWPQWGVIDSGMVRAGIAKCSLTIPVNIGAP